MNRYPRDMRGHGPNPPTPEWPGGAKIAVQFVVNYEEGGENCTLHPGVVLGPGCKVGNNVELHANVVCYADTIIGDDVTIQASAVLGADGFGYRFEHGAFKKLQHCGHVRIENNVGVAGKFHSQWYS